MDKFFTRKVIIVVVFLCAFNVVALDAFYNKFKIEYPIKEEYTDEDFLQLELILSKKNGTVFSDKFYTENLLDQNDFLLEKYVQRINSGFNLKLVDPKTNSFQRPVLLKIGKGGENCFVTYVSYNSPYPKMLKEMPKLLEEVGFDGYYLYQVGGYPTPTGIEINFIGVPYAFKIFMMLEAYARGFQKVIWLDSSFIPLKNPKPIFDRLEEEGVVSTGQALGLGEGPFLSKISRKSLYSYTGIDALSGVNYALAGLFGLKMGTIKAVEFINSYYELVQSGAPFCSSHPEEWVFSILLKKNYGDSYRHYPLNEVIIFDNQNIKNPTSFFLCRTPEGLRKNFE